MPEVEVVPLIMLQPLVVLVVLVVGELGLLELQMEPQELPT